MKKVISFVLSFSVIIFTFLTGSIVSANITRGDVFTDYLQAYISGYGDVQIYVRVQRWFMDTLVRENRVEAYQVFSFVTQDDEELFCDAVDDCDYDILYPSAYKLAPESIYYNCHSYAWYSQDTLENDYWFTPCANYFTEDYSYIQVTTPMVGDIIYYTCSEDFYVEDMFHSGIVVDVSNWDPDDYRTLIVESKWGMMGLYRHNAEENPYFGADRILFFRRNNHTHNHNVLSTFDENYHCCVCSCGQIIHSEHIWGMPYEIDDGDPTNHECACACGQLVQAPHLFNIHRIISGNLSYHQNVCSCGYTVNAPHRWVLTMSPTLPDILMGDVDSPMHFPVYKCSDCGAQTLNPPVIQ